MNKQKLELTWIGKEKRPKLEPRILLEEGLFGEVTWAIEQGAVGGMPLLGFAFGCASNADAIVGSMVQLAAPTVAGGRVFAISNDSELIALDAGTGEVAWNYQAIAESARILAAPKPFSLKRAAPAFTMRSLRLPFFGTFLRWAKACRLNPNTTA